MQRRRFLQTAMAASLPSAARSETGEKLTLSAPLTHSDWMLRDTVPGVVWGPDGVKHMLDACKAAGWSRIYWRALDGGRANYKSSWVTPGTHTEYDTFYNPITPEDTALLRKFFPNVSAEQARQILVKQNSQDYSTFDSLRAAVDYGHSIGLQVHAWISINEDDHGWGVRSDFSLKHPEYRWRKRDGRFYRSQISFAFPQAVDYKAAIVREIVENYSIDGIFLDWIRTGDVRDDPQADPSGVADRGYEEPLVAGFRHKFGRDPHSLPNDDERWVRYRAQPHTEFMRRVRAITKAKRLPVAVMVYHPWAYRGVKFRIDGNLRGMLLDVTAWAQQGLIDHAVAAGYYLEGGNAEKAYESLKSETMGKVDVWLYAWVPTSPEGFERDFRTAQKVGASQILFWEADYIDGRPNREALQKAMRTRAEF